MTLHEGSSEIQSLIFDKRLFDERKARTWINRHRFIDKEIDATNASFRFRQRDPNKFDRSSFRTITLTDGVKAVIGWPKSQKEAKMARRRKKARKGGRRRRFTAKARRAAMRNLAKARAARKRRGRKSTRRYGRKRRTVRTYRRKKGSKSRKGSYLSRLTRAAR
jgi:hypothetical protein